MREVWIDWLRVTAIFLVVIVHSTEPFYLGGEGSLILTESDAFWVSFFDSLARACVPLFIVASSYLQFPSHHSTLSFFKRRFIRVIIPFVVWTIVYAFVWGEPIENFQNLLLNFNYSAGHLWFVYMLIGIYLLIPLLSPWAEKVSKKELLLYLAICFFTSIIPFIRLYFGGLSPVIYGPTGIPAYAKYPLWGEASWNSYGLFYYFSGFIGYMLLGLYMRKFVKELSVGLTLLYGGVTFLVGFIISFGGFLWLVMQSAGEGFPLEGAVGLAALWETPWFYDSTGVVLMTIGWLIIYKKIKASGISYNKIILPFSKSSYGVYLCHMLILAPMSLLFREWLGIGTEASLGFWTTPVEILATAISTYLLATFASWIIGKIPIVGKYIMG